MYTTGYLFYPPETRPADEAQAREILHRARGVLIAGDFKDVSLVWYTPKENEGPYAFIRATVRGDLSHWQIAGLVSALEEASPYKAVCHRTDRSLNSPPRTNLMVLDGVGSEKEFR